MDYNHINSFLEKFKKLIFQKEELKEIVVRTISEEISHNIDAKYIKIKDACILIQASPILRSEILMHKKNILIKLESLLPNNHFLDIR